MLIVGKYADAYEAYSGEYTISLTIKSNIRSLLINLLQYVGNRCKVTINETELTAEVPYAKVTKNKIMMSMIFRVADNQVSDKNGQKIEMGVILGNMAGIDNLSVEIESIGAVVEKRCDPQFWTLIKGTLKDIAAYSGSALEWEITKRNIKSAYGVKFTVAEHMTQSQAEHYWDCIQEYVTENDIPVKTADNIIKDIEHYIATCRKNNTCCICGEKAHINIVYPLCVKHEVEYLELGKKAFDAHHHLPGAI